MSQPKKAAAGGAKLINRADAEKAIKLRGLFRAHTVEFQYIQNPLRQFFQEVLMKGAFSRGKHLYYLFPQRLAYAGDTLQGLGAFFHKPLEALGVTFNDEGGVSV